MKKLFIIFISLFVFGCGSLQKTKEEKKETTETNSNTITELNYERDSFTLEPIDLQRPILVGGKEYHNTIIKVEKEVGKETKNEEKKEVKEVQEKSKDVERDNTKLILGIFGIGFFFLFIIFIVGLYFLSKKISSVTKIVSS